MPAPSRAADCVDLDVDAAAWFSGRTAAIGTMHGKEAVVGPALARLGLEPVVAPGLDTDRFGTFTRDVSRAGDQLEAARRKAEAAMTATGVSIGVASEGSFGPHPTLPLVTVDLELVLLVDRTHGLEIPGHHADPAPVWHHTTVHDPGAALTWARAHGFPAHGLVVRAAPDDTTALHKGVRDDRALAEAVRACRRVSSDGSAFLETDLRAHVHPTRMRAIGRAAARLVTAASRSCPGCERPGFRRESVRDGLPCAWCNGPTTVARAYVHGCTSCGHRTEEPTTEAATADPRHCPRCNP